MRRQTRLHSDGGSSLILALVTITVIAVGVAVVLSFADTSIRATVALRGQASNAAGADGAAQIAINTLRNGIYDGATGSCFGASNTLTLANFYQPWTGPADSAAVTCDPDPTKVFTSPVSVSSANKPANAILSLGTAAGEDGVRIDVADGRDLKVHGSVFSNSTIAVPRGSLSSDGSITARGACTGTIVSNPAPACTIGGAVDPSGDDPNYPAPAASTTVRPVSVCLLDNQLITFTPGRYTDITSLNLIGRCLNTILYFPPGTYYFDFPDTTPWVINHAFLVGGAPTTPLVAGTPPTIPGACESPIPPVPLGGWTPPLPNLGVQFVFGGGARMILRNSLAELCGDYSTTDPPIAMYGLKSGVGPVPAQSGCTQVTPYPTSGCATLRAESTSKLYVQGTTYLPRAAVDIALNNSTGFVFSDGIIARTIHVAPTAGSVLTNPVIKTPDDIPPGRQIVLYLNVYLCPGAGTCTPVSGTRRLRAKVGILDPTGTAVAGARGITVYSWSVLR
jgi:hypothetical protein